MTLNGELEAAADQVHWGFLSHLGKKHLDNLQRHLPVMIYGVHTILFELLQSFSIWVILNIPTEQT